MQPFIEKPPLTTEQSFLARMYRTPLFEIPWHQHIEHELILFTEGEGLIFMGSYVGEFKPGDVFMIGSNLPHTFQKATPGLIVNAMVIQFRSDFMGSDWLTIPEAKPIQRLLETAAYGLQLSTETSKILAPQMCTLADAHGFSRLAGLMQCLAVTAADKQAIKLSAINLRSIPEKKRERIDRIFQYTMDNFQETITLEAMAEFAGMSVPAFCSYFKKCAKKTFVQFLNEVRVGYATGQLIDTQKSIAHICYESGYNSLTNFNRQFRKLKLMKPSDYRKRFGQAIQSLEGAERAFPDSEIQSGMGLLQGVDGTIV